MRFDNPGIISRNLAEFKRHIRFFKATAKLFRLMNEHAITKHHTIAFTFSSHFLAPFIVFLLGCCSPLGTSISRQLARAGQTDDESGFVHSNGNVRHLSGFTGLMRQRSSSVK